MGQEGEVMTFGFFVCKLQMIRGYGGIGRRTSLRSWRGKPHGGSSPPTPTMEKRPKNGLFFVAKALSKTIDKIGDLCYPYLNDT